MSSYSLQCTLLDVDLQQFFPFLPLLRCLDPDSCFPLKSKGLDYILKRMTATAFQGLQSDLNIFFIHFLSHRFSYGLPIWEEMKMKLNEVVTIFCTKKHKIKNLLDGNWEYCTKEKYLMNGKNTKSVLFASYVRTNLLVYPHFFLEEEEENNLQEE